MFNPACNSKAVKSDWLRVYVMIDSVEGIRRYVTIGRYSGQLRVMSKTPAYEPSPQISHSSLTPTTSAAGAGSGGGYHSVI